MKSFKHVSALVAIFTAAAVVGCGNKPLLTEMSTHKLIVVLKGTYESNSPAPLSIPTACGTWVTDPKDPTKQICTQYTVGHQALVQDDSVYLVNATTDENPHVFLLDVAELRLVDSHGDIHKFANYRQNFSLSLGDDNPYFNGTGLVVTNDDVPSKLYPFVMIYVRKMLLDSSLKYIPDSEGWSATDMWDAFAERQFPCFNFNKMQVHAFYDTLRLESSSLNRVFPVVIPIQDAAQGMIFNEKFPLTVLEIRFVVKNFIKKYEFETYINEVYSIVHYYALSDWLQDVKQDETSIGGNLLTVARSYIPGLVGTISGTNPNSEGRHIIAIPAGEDIAKYTIQGGRDNINPVPASLDDPYVPGTTITPRTSPRSFNPCDLSKQPTPYTGTSINQLLDYYLKLERYDYNWNQKVPMLAPPDPKSCAAGDPNCCTSYNLYTQGWDAFRAKVSGGDETGATFKLAPENFKLPQLVVYASSGGGFTFENVPPGRYDIYVANVAPRYGYLYYDGEFGLTPTVAGVTVNAGADTAVTIP